MPEAEQLLANPGTVAAAARLLLDLDFTPGLAAMICDAVGLDLAVLELAASLAVAAKGLALCALHHALFDLSVLGLTGQPKYSPASARKLAITCWFRPPRSRSGMSIASGEPAQGRMMLPPYLVARGPRRSAQSAPERRSRTGTQWHPTAQPVVQRFPQRHYLGSRCRGR